MTRDLSTQETEIVATYPSRQDAEVAKARLEERAVEAVIVADDVHPPLQLTEGVKLRVLEGMVDRARRILAERSATADGETGTFGSSKDAHEEESPNLTFGAGGFVQATAWTYVAAFLFMVAIILTGLLIGL